MPINQDLEAIVLLIAELELLAWNLGATYLYTIQPFPQV